MNFFEKNNKKIRHGSISIGITAAVIAAVLLLNIGMTALLSSNHIFMDMTAESYYTNDDLGEEKTTTMYTLMDETVEQLTFMFELIDQARGTGEPVVVDIIFCADPDILSKSTNMRYVYHTALSLEQAFPEHIRVKTTDVWKNPSSVADYRENSYSQIYPNNIIISSGNESRITTDKTYYIFSEYGSNIPWAYHGEKVFVSNILSVTQLESPRCYFTKGHGESYNDEKYSEFRNLIESVGFTIDEIDLSDPNAKIADDCRLIITLDPRSDFKTDYMNANQVNEIKKLEAYLDKAYSYMIFADKSTPELPVLEDFLAEWGIAFVRYDDSEGEGSYVLSDPKDSLDAKQDGTNLIGQYEVNAPSANWTEDIRKYGANPKVVFSDAIGIMYSKDCTETYSPANDEYETLPYTYGRYSSNGNYRYVYDLFRTGDSATAYAVDANGNRIMKDGSPVVNSASPFRLMTISSEQFSEAEGMGYTYARNAAYVCAVGSLRMISNEMLQSDAYSNTDVMLSVLRQMCKEVEPVDLNFKILHQDAINEELYATVAVTAWTIALIMIPLVICSGAGIFVLVRRRTRH